MQTASHRSSVQWALIKLLLFVSLGTEVPTQRVPWRNGWAGEDAKKERSSPQSLSALSHCDFTLDFGQPVKNEAAPQISGFASLN